MAEFTLAQTHQPERLVRVQRDLLVELVAGLRRASGILGVAAGGSFISADMDEFSDLDLVVLTDPAQFGEAPDRRHALAAAIALYRSLRERRAMPGLRYCADAEAAATSYLADIEERVRGSRR